MNSKCIVFEGYKVVLYTNLSPWKYIFWSLYPYMYNYSKMVKSRLLISNKYKIWQQYHLELHKFVILTVTEWFNILVYRHYKVLVFCKYLKNGDKYEKMTRYQNISKSNKKLQKNVLSSVALHTKVRRGERSQKKMPKDVASQKIALFQIWTKYLKNCIETGKKNCYPVCK